MMVRLLLVSVCTKKKKNQPCGWHGTSKSFCTKIRPNVNTVKSRYVREILQCLFWKSSYLLKWQHNEFAISGNAKIACGMRRLKFSSSVNVISVTSVSPIRSLFDAPFVRFILSRYWDCVYWPSKQKLWITIFVSRYQVQLNLRYI